jgi:hypothetical protein
MENLFGDKKNIFIQNIESLKELVKKEKELMEANPQLTLLEARREALKDL